MCSWYFMCTSLVLMKVWMRGRAADLTASAARRMSPRWERARPATTGPRTFSAIARTLSKSPGLAIGNPASITSAPSSASAWAMRSFSSRFIEKPGDCSPSRSVVSKMMTRSPAIVPKLGWVRLMVLSLVKSDTRRRRSGMRWTAPGRAMPSHARTRAQGRISRSACVTGLDMRVP